MDTGTRKTGTPREKSWTWATLSRTTLRAASHWLPTSKTGWPGLNSHWSKNQSRFWPVTVLTERMKSAVSTGVEGVAVEEMAEGLEERLVAQERPEHVEDAGPLGVGVGVEHVAGRVVAVGDDRPDVARLGLAQVGGQLALAG